MKRMLALLAWVLVSVLASESLAQTGDGYIGVFSDPSGTEPCVTIPQMTAATLYVLAITSGATASGITDAEFRIEVPNPQGWMLSYTAPAGADLVIGAPLDFDPDPDAGGGVNIAFSPVPDNDQRRRVARHDHGL